ncbi:MAG: type IX secretion system outer membrane channel protein PorV [Tannerellaceae bacterium]|nr:type IX secretion system outer membrane channel protein PorV [Tannerellaceae bacterium]MCD8263776.1 type IX secretion system outer membrane channel protein PorV [Tannerellaceae bacterium]
MIKRTKPGILFILLALFLFTVPTWADGEKDFAPINTAVPALSIAPDARGGGMGDNGVATLPDINSQYWNPAKYAFQYSKAGVALSYTPWLRKLVNDVALAYLAGYYKIGDSDLQAIGASLRYFSLGEVPQGDGYDGIDGGFVNPYEMALDVSYSRKLSESFSMAVAFRYIRSDMGTDQNDERLAGNAFAVDIAGYLERYIILGNSESLWSLGFNISNIGNKISYDGGNKNEFLPTTLKLGTGILFPLNDYNNLGIYVDFSRYLVPSLPLLSDASSQDEIDDYNNRLDDYNSMSSISGIFKSFSDSSNELDKIMVSIGAEYSYNDQFFVRGGYYYENPNRGNRQYFSIGAGFRMSVFQIDAAYLISTVQTNPLDQTLRFSLSFDMDGIKNLFR